jgi:hypothetical protein
VVTAPDALVYLNGETEVVGCPSCRRKFDLNKYITSITVDLSVDSVPGSASINLSVPRHSIDDIMFEGQPVITPMMEVDIFMKGYYLVEGLPQYYPVFWGMITEVGDAYSGGEHNITLQCADILKWWELSKMNINPAYTAPKGQGGWSIFGNVFFGKNPYDIIWQLCLHSFGDVVVGTGSCVSMYKESQQAKVFSAAFTDMMLYWEERFSRMRSNLLLYGTNGVAVRGASIAEGFRTKGGKPKSLASSAVATANGGNDALQMVFDPTGPEVVAFRTQGTQAGQINLWQSEYQTKLELANAAKEAAGFEFYMDVTGDIVFKPPFYNLDIMSNKPVSWIQDIDVIEWDFSESEAEVVTQVILQGNYTGNIDWGLPEECTPYTSVTDYHLLRRYGWRSQNYNSEFMSDPTKMFYHGMDILDRMNSKRHRGSVGIPLRPELRLGFPIYVAPKDQIWYISGISHNITFGGRAQTTLTLTARRSKFIAPRGIGTLKMDGFNPPMSGKGKNQKPLDVKPYDKAQWGFRYSSRQLARGAHFTLRVGDTAELPPTQEALDKTPGPYEPLILRHPKTGRIMGYPNVVMVYTRPFAPTDEELRKVSGQKNPNAHSMLNPKNQKKVQEQVKQQLNDSMRQLAFNSEDAVTEKHHVNRYSYGLNSAGVYVYAHDASDPDIYDQIREFALVPASNIAVEGLTDEQKAQKKVLFSQSAMIRPVSDERGFEVVGHFRYGRGISLRDGSLVRAEAGNNLRANVDVQLALTGDLFASLDAQSQGLTSISSAYANPIDAVARMQPDDLQTAAILNPETKEVEFVPVEEPFIDTAPLGSPESKGLPVSVEAGQLSRALTLAEMTVAEQVIVKDNKCNCLMGRSDLAFINVGYQTKFMGATVPDESTLFGSQEVADAYNKRSFQSNPSVSPEVQEQRQTISDRIEARQKHIDDYKAKNQELYDEGAILLNQKKGKTPRAAEIANALQANMLAIQVEEEEIAKLEAEDQKLAPDPTYGLTPGGIVGDDAMVKPARSDLVALSPAEAQTKVDQFLFGLYSALDGPHQEYEDAIRGKTLTRVQSGGYGTDEERSRLPEQGALSPPFSAPNRYAVGDPLAIGLQGSQAKDQITQAWSEFSDNMQSSGKRAKLQGEISKLQKEVDALEKRKAELLAMKSSGGAILNVGGTDPVTANLSGQIGPSMLNIDAEIAKVEKEIAEKQQQIANKQQQLAQMAQ